MKNAYHLKSRGVTWLILFILASLSSVWAKDGISGKVYSAWSYDLSEGADGYNAFTLDRLYFTFATKLADDVALNLTSDIINPASDNARFVYQKYAYLKWSTALGNLVFGLQGMNVFNIAEKNWGYRYIAKSAMDMHKFASSADLGFGYKKSFSEMIHIHLTMTNGSGYKKNETDKYKKLAAQVIYGELDLSKHSGYNAGVSFSRQGFAAGLTDSTAGVTENNSVLAVFGCYDNKRFRLGGEFDRYMDSGTEKTKQITSLYGAFKISDQLKILARLDNYDPDVDGESDSEMLIIAGLDYHAAKGLTMGPTFHYDAPESGGSAQSEFRLNLEFKF